MIATDTVARLKASNVRKAFQANDGNEYVALADVSLSVSPHEFVSVIGPSGCGKSTFLRIVAGLDQPNAGKIFVDGMQVSRPGADRGMVFQEYALLPWKTALTNVAFGLQIRGIAKEERLSVARQYLALVGLSGFEGHYPHQLSGGMRQRTAVARALANQPSILLMDEPFAAIDALTRKNLQEELSQIGVKEKTTVLFVTHSIEEAVFLSDRVVVLSERPSSVIEEVCIDIPRPRRWDALIGDPAFIKWRDHLLKLLNYTDQVQPGHV
jgi:ABC-type nitrate/sulfonate/bicarbonate transport system ATPase subunit